MPSGAPPSMSLIYVHGIALIFPRREHLQAAVHKVELLWEENNTRWPPHSLARPNEEAPISLWDIQPGEVRKEETAQMTHD